MRIIRFETTATVGFHHSSRAHGARLSSVQLVVQQKQTTPALHSIASSIPEHALSWDFRGSATVYTRAIVLRCPSNIVAAPYREGGAGVS